MIESFKAVLEKEREAEKLTLEAEEQAKKIEQSAHERAEAVYKETYQETISDAKRKSIKILERSKKDAESEAQIFIKRAEKLKKKILVKAEQKFGEAVDSILHEILS